MDRTFKTVLLLTIVLTFLSSVTLAQKHYKDLTYPQLNKINIPEVERVELANGMILFLVEDHELPLINMRARIGVGSIYEPAGKVGLASITGAVMRTGGSKTISGDAIDEELESIAASVETGIGTSSGFASLSVLKGNIDTGLSILADILMNPAFPDEKIELQKVEEKSAISRRNDDVNGILFREFSKLIYGPKNEYARHPEYENIDAITRDDLVAFHKRYFHPNNVMLGIWGDFKKKDMVKKIEGAFKDWKKTAFQRPEPPAVKYEFDYSVNLIQKDDVNQSNILLGHIGGKLDNPDYFALRVMNEILGGGFASRLFSRVRSDQGLAYAVFGQYSANYDYPGEFYVGCMTKSETTIQAVRSLLREVELMKTDEITDREMNLAKESFLNSYVFNFDTRSEVVNRLMTYEYYGYPRDFLEQTKENIEKVTKADVRRVAQKYLQPEKVRILIVGKVDDFDEPPSVLGTVNEIDIEIPRPVEETPEATPESLAKGKEALQDAISACGGAKAFKAIKSVRYRGKMKISTPQGDIAMDAEMNMAFPDRVRVDMSTPMGEMSQVMNGPKAWMVTAQGSRPAPPQMTQQMQASLWHDLAYLFAHVDSDGLTAQHLGMEEVEGQACDLVLITPKGIDGFKIYIHSESGMPVKVTYQGTNMQGAPVMSEETYSDFRDVGSVKLPFKSVIHQDGKKAQEATASDIKINVEVDEERFVVEK